MIEKEKREFGSWWAWIVAPIVFTVAVDYDTNRVTRIGKSSVTLGK